MVAQVGDPCAVAVAGREMHAIRRCKHLLQVALAVGKGLPQVKVNASLAGGQLSQLLVHTAQHIRCKAGLFGSCRGSHRRDRLHVDHAVLAQSLAQHIQHLAIVGKEAIRSAQRGEGVSAQQDIQFLGPGSGQHIQRYLLPAGGAFDCAAVHNGIRANAGIAADECPAQIDLVIREAHRQTVAQKGCVRKVAQVHLPAAGLADDAGIIGFDGVGPSALLCRAKVLQCDGLPTGAAILCSTAAIRFALHGQRCQNVLGNAAGVGKRGIVRALCALFQNGRDGVGYQQNGDYCAQKAQLAADCTAPCPARRRMILV